MDESKGNTQSSSGQRQRATVTIGDYELGPQIGRGSFAIVYKGINKKTNTLVAIKSVVRSSLTRRLLENLEIEINILRTVKHPRIVELIDCLKSRNHIHLVMEYCSLGDLSLYMKKRKDHNSLKSIYGGLNMAIVNHFVKQLGEAIKFLRSRDIIHRDIKTQNILLQPPNPEYTLGASETSGVFPLIKVADFGFARNLPSTSLAETLCGSPLYMAPEILHYEPYDAKVDLWSIGAVIFEIIAGRPPFYASNHVELARVIERTNDRIVFPDDPEFVTSPTNAKSANLSHQPIDSRLKDLVSGLLKMNPANRMSFAQFFAHPGLNLDSSGPNDSPVEPSQPHHEVSVQRDPIVSHHYQYLNSRQQPNVYFGDDGATSNVPPTPPKHKHQIQPKDTSIHRRTSSLSSEEHALYERDYVVVEKRAIEMNVLADALEASSPPTATFYPPRPGAIQKGPGVAKQMTALARAIRDAVSTSEYDSDTVTGFNPLDSELARAFEARYTQGIQSEEPTVRRMEGLAYKAFALSYLADVKWACLPNAQSTNKHEDLFIDPINVTLSDAFVLYLKALELLHRAMLEAAQYWADHKPGATRNTSSTTVTVTSDTASVNSTIGSVSVAFNAAVQWVRDKFNECLERAEMLRLVSKDLEVADVSVEQTLYEQALALSKAAALRELKWIDPLECDRAYQLAIWMLSAILETADDTGENGEPMDLEDRTIIERFVASIVKRREALQKRLIEQQTKN